MNALDDIEKIRHIANQYTVLTQREEIDLVSALQQARSDHVHVLAVMFEQDPRYAVLFYQNYQAKRRAVQNGDMETWNKIIEKELRDVREMMGIEE